MMMPRCTSGPQSHTTAATHTNSRAPHTRGRTQARAQAGTHTHKHARIWPLYFAALRASFGTAWALGVHPTPAYDNTCHYYDRSLLPILWRCRCTPQPWLRTGSTLLLPGGSTHFDKLLFLHVVPFREEADQSDLTLCVVTLVPTDPSVGPIGEEFGILCLIHLLLLPEIQDFGGHFRLWEKNALYIHSLLPSSKSIVISRTSLKSSRYVVRCLRIVCWMSSLYGSHLVSVQNSTRGHSLRFAGLSMLYCSSHCLKKSPVACASSFSASYCPHRSNRLAHPLPSSQDMPHLRLV